jgi:hypothetical protein
MLSFLWVALVLNEQEDTVSEVRVRFTRMTALPDAAVFLVGHFGADKLMGLRVCFINAADEVVINNPVVLH